MKNSNTKKKTGILIALLVLSLCANIVLGALLFSERPAGSVVGTYCTGDGMSQDDCYLVFLQDSTYVLYKQFEIVEKGRYYAEDGGVYLLRSEDKTKETLAVFDGADQIRYYEPGAGVLSFTRISDIPAFINLPD